MTEQYNQHVSDINAFNNTSTKLIIKVAEKLNDVDDKVTNLGATAIEASDLVNTLNQSIDKQGGELSHVATGVANLQERSNAILASTQAAIDIARTTNEKLDLCATSIDMLCEDVDQKHIDLTNQINAQNKGYTDGVVELSNNISNVSEQVKHIDHKDALNDISERIDTLRATFDQKSLAANERNKALLARVDTLTARLDNIDAAIALTNDTANSILGTFELALSRVSAIEVLVQALASDTDKSIEPNVTTGDEDPLSVLKASIADDK